jgi:hypothetical protein
VHRRDEKSSSQANRRKDALGVDQPAQCPSESRIREKPRSRAPGRNPAKASRDRDNRVWQTRKAWPGFVAGLILLSAIYSRPATLAQERADWVTGLPRESVHVSAWPDGRKVAVSFALFVEEFGFGQGPVFRPDLASRSPDLDQSVWKAFRAAQPNAPIIAHGMNNTSQAGPATRSPSPSAK